MFLFTRFVCRGGRLARQSDKNVPPTRLVRNHSLYFRRIGVAYERRGAEMALALLFLRRQDVAQKRLIALHLSCSRLLEALGRALVCF